MLHTEPPLFDWSLMEALLWIVFRNEDSVNLGLKVSPGYGAWSTKQVIQAGRDAAHNHVFSKICVAEEIEPDDPQLQDKMRATAHKRAQFRHPLLTPEDMLMDALRGGAVHASGTSSSGTRERIDVENWRDAQFYGAQSVVIMDADNREQPVILCKWVRVRFDRQSLALAFPHQLRDEELKQKFLVWVTGEHPRPSIGRCVIWGKDHNLNRQWIRDQRALLTPELKRSAGREAQSRAPTRKTQIGEK